MKKKSRQTQKVLSSKAVRGNGFVSLAHQRLVDPTAAVVRHVETK